MKKSVKLSIILIVVAIISACAAKGQPQPQTVTQSNPTATPDLNTEFLNFANQNPEIVKQNILITCKTAYPELNITDAAIGSVVSYVVDQNPMTLNYNAAIEIDLNNSYFVDINSTGITAKDKNKSPIIDTNIKNIVVSEALKITSNRSKFTTTVTLEKVNGAILTKSASCIFTE